MAGSGAWPPAGWNPPEHEVRSGVGAGFLLGPGRAAARPPAASRAWAKVSRLSCPHQLLHVQDVALDRLLEV